MFEASFNYKFVNESHMMKNTEWGAVTYLSLSKYGINKKININNNSDQITGYSAVSSTNQSVYPGTCGTDSTVTLPYNTEIGYLASTTGNISGIYDMSGGVHESMAAYFVHDYTLDEFSQEPALIYGENYFDVYGKDSLILYSNKILGDATAEFGPFYYYADGDEKSRYHNNWFASHANFPGETSPWLCRGGYYRNGILADQTNFDRFISNINDNIGFRIILTK